MLVLGGILSNRVLTREGIEHLYGFTVIRFYDYLNLRNRFANE